MIFCKNINHRLVNPETIITFAYKHLLLTLHLNKLTSNH